MSQVLIRRSGTLIDISPDGQNPLDPRIVALLKPMLSYEHKTLLRGHQRYSPDGHVRHVDIEVRDMFVLEEGRLVTGFGFLTTIVEVLRAHGITPRYIDLSPPKDPQTYLADWDNVRRHISFRPKQEECLYYISRNECGLINATVGFGKSFLFEAICHLYPYAKIDIVVRPKDVAKSIARQLTGSLPNVGQVGGGKLVQGERVTVYTAGSCHRASGDADILLGDEVHLLMTDKTSRAMAAAWRYTRNFGFTATPSGRMDGADAQLEMFFGREIFRLTYPEAVQLGLVVPIHVRWLPIRMDRDPAAGKEDTVKMRWGIWRNEVRNRAIADDVRLNYQDQNTQILILVATVDHAIMLWQHLPDFSLCYSSMDDEDIERYKRNHLLPENFVPTTPEVRERMRQAFSEGTLKRVIATDVWSTGVSFDQLSVLYRADARASEILDAQAPGRVSRIHTTSGKQYGEVVDCYDVWNRSFKRKSEQRKRNYAALGWTQDWPNNRSQIDA